MERIGRDCAINSDGPSKAGRSSVLESRSPPVEVVPAFLGSRLMNQVGPYA